MSIQTVTIEQLKQVIAIKEQIAALEAKLGKIIGGKSAPVAAVVAPVKKGRKKMSAAGKARIAAAQKARWAKVKGTAPAPAQSVTPKAAPAVKPAKRVKRKLSPEGRAKIVAALKKRWAAKKKS